MKHPDALAQQIIDSCSPSPDEEDFWAIAIVYDDPDLSGWEKRLNFMGRLVPAVSAAVKAVPVIMASLKPKQSISIQTFQGEKARWFLQETLKQESAYQQQLRSLPNN